MIATPFASWTCARPTAAHVVVCQEANLQNPLGAAEMVVVDAGLVVVVAGGLVVVAGSRLLVVAGVVVITESSFLYSWNSEAPELGIV